MTLSLELKNSSKLSWTEPWMRTLHMVFFCELYSFLGGRSRHLIMRNATVFLLWDVRVVCGAQRKGNIHQIARSEKHSGEGLHLGFGMDVRQGLSWATRPAATLQNLPGNLFKRHGVGRLFSRHPLTRYIQGCSQS